MYDQWNYILIDYIWEGEIAKNWTCTEFPYFCDFLSGTWRSR